MPHKPDCLRVAFPGISCHQIDEFELNFSKRNEIAILQLFATDFSRVYDNTVTAIQIFDFGTGFVAGDSCMHSADKLGSNLDIVFRAAPDRHGPLEEGVFETLIAIDDNQ